MNVKSIKKGFTLTELIIVIVIIGILAGVLIPTFINVVNKANKAADLSLIRNLNEALTLDRYDRGEHKHMTAALDAVEDYGFEVEKIDAKVSKNKILWDSKNDVFCYLVGDDTLEYYPNSVDESDKIKLVADYYKLWIINNEVPFDSKFSIYYTGEGTSITVNNVGFDVGKSNVTEVKYNGSLGNDVVIRTNSASTNIVLNPYVDSTDSTKGDHISFYGKAGQITGPKDEFGNYIGFTIAFNSVAINGKVVGLKAASGHIDLTDAVVEEDEEIIILATTTDVKVSNPNNVSTHAHATSESDANIMNNTVDSTKKSVGVIWDYDGNVAQNEIDDIHHHITDAQAEVAGESLGTGPVDGGGEWNYEDVVEEVVYVALNEEVSETSSYVARIGGQGYETLEAAFTAAVNGDTIVMLKDVESTGYIAILDLKVALDLNGHTITSRVNGTSVFIPNNANAEFTLEDSIGTGAIYDYGTASSALNAAIKVNKGKFIMNGGTIQTFGASKNNPKNPVYVGTNKTCVINGGQLSGKFISIVSVGNLTINGGTIYGENQGVQNQSNLIINNGNVSSAKTAIYNTKNVTINDGTISGETIGIDNSGTLTILNGTISANSYYGISNSGTCTINGGTIISGTHDSYGRGILNNGTAKLLDGEVITNKEHFSSNIVAVDNRKTLVLDGATIKSNSIAVFNADSFTFNSGNIEAGTQGIQTHGTTVINGGTIAGTNCSGINVFNGTTTINKVNIEIEGDTIDSKGIFTQNNAIVNIKGSEVSINAIKPIWLYSANSVCNIEGGTYNSRSGEVCYTYEGEFNISGGTFTGAGSSNYSDDIYRFTINCYDDNYKNGTARINITGGSYYQYDPNNNQSEGVNTDHMPEGYVSTSNEETGYYTVTKSN